MRASIRASILALGLLAGSAFGATDLQTCLSGWEVSAGHKVGDTTTGVTFTGLDSSGAPNSCTWTTVSQGGVWYARIDRQGTAGIGGDVTVTGGRWWWDTANGALYRGRVLNDGSGEVVWPATDNGDLGCGPGVATFFVNLSVQGHKGGSFEGCLDDTHIFSGVFPPHIWGLLTIHL